MSANDGKITAIGQRELTIREQAEKEVREEQSRIAVTELKKLLKQKAAAEAVVKGIELQIADYEQQIADGTN